MPISWQDVIKMLMKSTRETVKYIFLPSWKDVGECCVKRKDQKWTLDTCMHVLLCVFTILTCYIYRTGGSGSLSGSDASMQWQTAEAGGFWARRRGSLTPDSFTLWHRCFPNGFNQCSFCTLCAVYRAQCRLWNMTDVTMTSLTKGC